MEDTASVTPIVTLTPNAIKEVKRLQEVQGLGNAALRLGVKGGGCSGLSYTVNFDTEMGPYDQSYEIDGIRIIVDMKSAIYLQGTQLDYQKDLVSGQFKFSNPNATKNCGCGESFLCWHCQSDIGGEYFCGQCVKVQPLSKDIDYFTCLGLPRKLNIDTVSLETKFYELSRVFHPDFFEGKSEMERAVSLANSAILNQAYRTLKDPIQRVEYLLRLEAGAAKDIPGKAPADLFEAILKMQEDLEEFHAAKAENDAETLARAGELLRGARKALEAKRAALENRLAELFQIWDKLVEKQAQDQTQPAAKERTLKEMRDLLSERTYVMNMLQNLKEALA